MANLTPKQVAATHWWNKLPPGERTRLIAKHGVGLENCVAAYEVEQAHYTNERKMLNEILDRGN